MLKMIIIAVVLALVVFTSITFFNLRSNGLFRSPVYDAQAPDIPDLKHPAILVLSKTNGFIHKEGLPAAGKMLEELALEHNWHLYQSENAATHNPTDLARFDVVIWNNTSGDILTLEQRRAFKSWLSDGGQWLGLHAAGGDPSYDWRWYADTLIGAQFFGHTMSPQFQDADVLVVAQSELTEQLPRPWTIPQEEWYAFDRNPRDTGSTILLALDETSYDTDETVFPDPSMPGEHPIAWTHSIGKGTIIYSGIGHGAATYELPEYREFLVRSINSLIGRVELVETSE
ncbi:MAG: type 1 glutamine amidotransferase [Halioglobus sp.]|jgi:type 1 glutamine amidotransferase